MHLYIKINNLYEYVYLFIIIYLSILETMSIITRISDTAREILQLRFNLLSVDHSLVEMPSETLIRLLLFVNDYHQ